jgi:predicted house-cleaning noncanonical NTP pyrophosphatase (MazG superfamily)
MQRKKLWERVMSWYGDGSFKQDLLESLEEILERHDVNAFENISEILEVVAYVAGKFDYKAEVYVKAKADAKYEIEAKIRESLK